MAHYHYHFHSPEAVGRPVGLGLVRFAREFAEEQMAAPQPHQLFYSEILRGYPEAADHLEAPVVAVVVAVELTAGALWRALWRDFGILSDPEAQGGQEEGCFEEDCSAPGLG